MVESEILKMDSSSYSTNTSSSSSDNQDSDHQNVEIPPMRPNDLLIAVMGVTGSGKSTFISHFCPDAAVGHGLESCTSKVSVFHCKWEDGRSAYFVDTPGFDDTYKKDTDILREIADYLSNTYEHKVLLSGIVYLHRISDPRIGGSAITNLNMFKKLVGEQSLQNVVLATTMWSAVPDRQLAIAREAELTKTDHFWQAMVRQGSRVLRVEKGADSAKEIVQYISERSHRSALAIQMDMVDRKLKLNETAAGKEMQGEIERRQAEYDRQLREIQQAMKEAMADRDKQHQRDLQKYQRDVEEKMRASEDALTRLEASKEDIRMEMEARFKAEEKRLREAQDLAEKEKKNLVEELQKARDAMPRTEENNEGAMVRWEPSPSSLSTSSPPQSERRLIRGNSSSGPAPLPYIPPSYPYNSQYWPPNSGRITGPQYLPQNYAARQYEAERSAWSRNYGNMLVWDGKCDCLECQQFHGGPGGMGYRCNCPICQQLPHGPGRMDYICNCINCLQNRRGFN